MAERVKKGDVEYIDSFIRRLKEIFKDEIKLSGHYSRPVDDLDPTFAGARSREVTANLSGKIRYLTKYIKFVHRWVPANPSKDNVVESANELYVTKLAERDKSMDYPPSMVANLIIKDHEHPQNRIYNIERIIKDNKYIVVEGNKGVGKTTFFNYWLNNRSIELEKSMDLVWFRVDASKLYEAWRKSPLDMRTDNLNLEAYHKIHTVYVVLKYGSSKKSRSDIMRSAYEYANKMAQENDELLNSIRGLMSFVEKSESAADGKNTEHFVGYVMRHEMISDTERVYHCFSQCWQENKVKVMFIVDGVDNIAWERRSRSPDYELLCSEVGGLFLNDYRKPYSDLFDKIVVIIRPETLKDIQERMSSVHMDNDVGDKFEVCVIYPACTEEVLVQKSLVAQSPESILVKKGKDNLIKDIEADISDAPAEDAEEVINSELEAFSKFSNQYFSKMIKCIQNVYGVVRWDYDKKEYPLRFSQDSFQDASKCLQILFNDNIRACVDNFVESYATVKLIEEKGSYGGSLYSRYPQYLLLNGRFFLDSSNINDGVRGKSYPNIFWWDTSWESISSKKWMGLVTIRLLQTLTQKRTISYDFCIDLVSNVFGVEDNLVRQQMYRMIQYGLIRYDNIFEENESLKVRITDKGSFILEFSFMYPNWLYFCCLDTPLEEAYAGGKDSRYVKLHRGSEYEFMSIFNVAYITSLITFIRHIYTQQRLDEKNLIRHWGDYSVNNGGENFFMNKDHALKSYSIPDHFDRIVLRSIDESFYSLYNRSKHECKELYRDLIGLYGESDVLCK